jgi:chorismate dehydratase
MTGEPGIAPTGETAVHGGAASVGIIDFLNSLPIHLGLESGAVPLPDGVRLVRGTPTELNRRISEGELAVASVSSIHWARQQRDLTLLPTLTINSRGFVHSVTLFYKDDISTLDGGSICVTGDSATSEVLLRLLLPKRLGIQAKLFRGKPDLDAIGRAYDGALLIGDAALGASLQYPNLGRRDLGLEWAEFTGTPMVFAVWVASRRFAARDPRKLEAVEAAFRESRAWGERHRGAVVEAARARSGLPRTLLENYFRSLRFDFDPEVEAGLSRFLHFAKDLGEIPEVPAIARPTGGRGPGASP